MNKKDIDRKFNVLKSQWFVERYEVRWSKKDKNCNSYEIVWNSYKWITHFTKIPFDKLDSLRPWEIITWIQKICYNE